MNILIINFGLYKGGTETQFHTVISTFKELQKEKYRFVIASLKNNSTFDRRIQMIGIPWYENLMRYKGDIFTIPRLLSIIKKENVNAIYVTGSTGYIIPISVLAGIASKRPVIAQYDEIKNVNIPIYNKPFIRFLYQIITVTETQKTDLINEGADPKKIKVIYNAVDMNTFDPYRIPIDKSYLELSNINRSTPLVGILASLFSNKGHEVFLRAAKIINERIKNTRYLIVGDGPKERVLKELVTKLNLEGKVFFLGWRTDIPELIKTLDVVVLSSYKEACPVVILEAMAMRKPVVTTAVGGIPEIVVDGKTGFLVPTGNEEELAKAIIKILENVELSSNMGNEARKRVERHYCMRKKIDKLSNLFSDIMAKKS